MIADDHSVVRRGLRQLLEAEAGLEVVAEAEDVDGARRYVHGHHPDVLVLDLNMPGGSTFELIPQLRAEFPDTEIVVLTMQNEPAYARGRDPSCPHPAEAQPRLTLRARALRARARADDGVALLRVNGQ